MGETLGNNPGTQSFRSCLRSAGLSSSPYPNGWLMLSHLVTPISGAELIIKVFNTCFQLGQRKLGLLVESQCVYPSGPAG